jgi:GT2 family glycosyltransferase
VPEGAFDVVVARDAADDDAPAVERAVEGRPFPVRLLTGPEPGVAATRDAGWRAADAPLVLFLGDDMLPRPDVVAQHLAWQERHPEPEVAVLGHVRWSPELRLTPFMRWLDHGMQFDYPNIEGIEAGWGRFYAANCSLKADLLERSGGFDHEFRFGYEELELARRMRDLGLRVLYNRAAVVEHLHPTTLDSWRERMRTVAAAELQMVRKHPDVAPYFHDMFSRVAERAAPRGRAARLAGAVPRWVPWLGPRVWASADAYWRHELARAFLPAWEEAQSTKVR